jgi:hypothetical protein
MRGLAMGDRVTLIPKPPSLKCQKCKHNYGQVSDFSSKKNPIIQRGASQRMSESDRIAQTLVVYRFKKTFKIFRQNA